MATNERTPLPLTARSGGLAFSAMIIIYMILSVLVQSVLLAFSVKEGALFTAVNAIVAPLSMIAVLVLSKAYSHRKISFTLGVKKCGVKYFALAAMLAVGMFFGLGFVNDFISGVLKGWGANVGGISLSFNGISDVLLFVLVLAIIPAVVEEVFFRGLMLKSLEDNKLWQCVLFVSVCFAVYHCSAVQLVYQIIYGGALCLLAYAAGSTLPCILAHFTNNFAVVLLTYLGVEIDFYNPVIICCGLAVFAAFAFFTVFDLKKRGAFSKEQTADDAQEFWWPVGILGTAICVVLIFSNLFIGA